MIRLPCYEPAGRVLELSPDDLTRHVIAFGSTGSGKTTALINPVLRQLLVDGMLRPLSQRRLELALAEVKNWRNLDPRTKETHRGTLHNALRPLLSSVAHAFFAPKPVEFRPRSVLDGKILVVSLDAVSHPDLARLIFRIVRQDFYAAVQSRKVVRPDQDRLCGLVADELFTEVPQCGFVRRRWPSRLWRRAALVPLLCCSKTARAGH